MAVILEQYSVHDIGTIEIRQPVNLVISAREAQRCINSWLSREVDMMLTSGEPTLIVGQKTRWQVPVLFTAPHVGPASEVGIIEIDAESGKIGKDSAPIDSWLNAAEILRQQLSEFKVHELPDQYLKNQAQSTVPAAPQLAVQADGELIIST